MWDDILKFWHARLAFPSQVASVATISLAGFAVIYSHAAGRFGPMKFDTIKVSHVCLGVRLTSTWMAVIRFCFATYVAANLYVMSQGNDCWPTFTVWCWTGLGMYFLLTSTFSAIHASGQLLSQDNRVVKCLCCVAWVWFEVMFSCALLVFIAVWCVLLPVTIISTGSGGTFVIPATLSVHNVNVLFVCLECFLGKMRFNRSHFVFVIYYGGIYLIFSWCYQIHSGIAYYFFTDMTTPAGSIGTLLCVGVLWSFFMLGSFLSQRIKGDDEGDATGAVEFQAVPQDS